MGSFTSKQTPQEQMKVFQREIQKACRELDRERRKLELSQSRIESEIKAQESESEFAHDKADGGNVDSHGNLTHEDSTQVQEATAPDTAEQDTIPTPKLSKRAQRRGLKVAA